MTLFCELSEMAYIIYGMCGIVLMIMAVFLLVTVCALHMERRYLAFSTVLVIAALIVLQSICDLVEWLNQSIMRSVFAELIGNLPYFVIIIIMCLIAAGEVVFFILLRRKRRDMLTPGAIKESLDALPDGVCFFDSEGQPLLVNRQMNRISGELFHAEILNAKRFWSALKNKEVDDDIEVIRTEPTVLVRTRDNVVWDFRQNTLTVGRLEIYEIIACDITKQWDFGQELDKQNHRLRQINKRLRLYSQEVERITTEDEILTAKMQVHDNVGRSLLAFRSYLEQPESKQQRDELLLLWRYTIEVLRHEAMPDRREDDIWSLLLKAAKSVDVEIICKEELPDDEKERTVLIAALHECLTNTVKHANGNKLYLSLEKNRDSICAELSNNGKAPVGKIQESGGLKNLRYTVEAAGGTMLIESIPRFKLRIELPNGGNCL